MLLYWPFVSLDRFIRSTYFRIYELVLVLEIVSRKSISRALLGVFVKEFCSCCALLNSYVFDGSVAKSYFKMDEF